MPLTPCTDVSAAAWISDSDVPWDELIGFGPQEFPAYARLLFLPDPIAPGQPEPTEGPFFADDALGEIRLLGLALTVLAERTRAPDDLYFCLWDGWNTPPALRAAPRVAVPNRSYWLFRGTLADFTNWDTPGMFGDNAGNKFGAMPPSAFIWPSDHAWCTAFDVDPHYAGIGASAEAIAQLIAHPDLHVVLADPTEQQPYYL